MFFIFLFLFLILLSITLSLAFTIKSGKNKDYSMVYSSLISFIIYLTLLIILIFINNMRGLFYLGVDLIAVWIIVSFMYCIELLLYLTKFGNIVSSFIINAMLSISCIIFFLGIFGINLDNRREYVQVLPAPAA